MPRTSYDEFKQELDRTAVISDEFKRALRLRVEAVERQAYDRGFTDGRKPRPEVQACQLTPSEERWMTEAGRLSDIGLDNQIDELSHMFANMLSGERVPSFAREARQLAAALLLRTRRGGLYLKNEVTER